MDGLHVELGNKIKQEHLNVPFHLVNSIKLEKPDQETKDASVIEGEVPENHEIFECTLCTLIFPNQKLLEDHIITHTRETLEKEDSGFTARATKSVKLMKSSQVCSSKSILQKERKYQCDLCQKSFVRSEHLRRHIKTHEPTEERCRFPCKFCSKTFLQEYQLGIHMNVHTGEKPFQCEFCETRFRTTRNRLIHVKKSHTKENPKLHKCNQCPASFEWKSKLDRHEITHIIRTETDQLDPRLFKCPKCEKTFTQDGHLKSHLLVHDNPNQFACDVCGKNYTRKCSLDKHKLLHGTERKFVCTFCPMKFTRFDELNMHFRNHTGENPYKCKYCLVCFVQLGNLEIHQRTSCRIIKKLRGKCQESPEVSIPAPFRCRICPKYFGSLQQLKIHVSRVHEGDKPFNCNLCDKRYGYKQHLESHIAGAHTKENPYRCKCNFCDKIYRNKSSLRRHYASRSGSLCRQKQDKKSKESADL